MSKLLIIKTEVVDPAILNFNNFDLKTGITTDQVRGLATYRYGFHASAGQSGFMGRHKKQANNRDAQ